jgi:hypothetical protein
MSAKPANQSVIDIRCKFVGASGRRCRAEAMRDTSRASGYSAFCLPHSQMEQQFLDAKSVAAELIGELDDFRTHIGVNEVLGKLLILVAHNRIPLRNANTISYICQLLLASLPGVRRELHVWHGESEERFVINRTTDILYGKTEEEEEQEEEEEEEEAEEHQNEEPREEKHETTKPSACLPVGRVGG